MSVRYKLAVQSCTLRCLYSAPSSLLGTHRVCSHRGAEVALVTIDSQILRSIDILSRDWKELGDGLPKASREIR